jgi:N-acetyl-anhydromuramyl-L-alanine amidase AmpD
MEVKHIVSTLPRKAAFKCRALGQLEGIVTHHFAGNISIEDAAKLHIQKWGKGISYHFVIDFDGTVYRCNDLDAISYHCGGHNTKYLGIALRGNWDKEMPPYAMLEALNDLIITLRRVMGGLPVYCHSDFRPTACPGGCLRAYLKEKYPSPAPLKVRLSKFGRLWHKWFGKDKDHPLID